MDHMKILSPVGLNLVVDGTVPKVWESSNKIGFWMIFNLSGSMKLDHVY